MWQYNLSGSNNAVLETPDAVHDLTIADILGPVPWYNVRPSVSAPGWLSPNQAVLDAITGTQLIIAGNIPVVCSHSVVAPQALALLKKAGLALASNVTVYSQCAEYLKILGDTTRKCAAQFIHPTNELPPDNYWVPRALLGRLNNKGNLGELVGEACLPPRRIINKSAKTRGTKFPIVVKVASDEASGSGCSVRICHDAAALRKARKEFGAHDLVLEEHFSIRRSLCIQFAVLPDGACHYLGASEQVTNQAGVYEGNWLDSTCVPTPDALLACRIAIEKAATLGYRGIAGFDTAELDDGRVFVYDLNFRINGSSTALLLKNYFINRYGKQPVLRLRAWPFTGTFEVMLRHIETWLSDGRFVPFSMYQPNARDTKPRVTGVLVGKSRATVKAAERAWIERGFDG